MPSESLNDHKHLQLQKGFTSLQPLLYASNSHAREFRTKTSVHHESLVTEWEMTLMERVESTCMFSPVTSIALGKLDSRLNGSTGYWKPHVAESRVFGLQTPQFDVSQLRSVHHALSD